MAKENNINSIEKGSQSRCWTPVPDDIEDIIWLSGFTNSRWADYAMAYLLLMRDFYRKCSKDRVIRLSTLKRGLTHRQCKSVDTLVSCKWLFYKSPVGGDSKDYIVQPIFDLELLTPEQYAEAVMDLRSEDYGELARTVPQRIGKGESDN